MNVTVDLTARPPAIALEDADEFRSFKVVIVGEGDADAVREALSAIGRLLDDDTAMLEITAVPRLPGARADDPSWRDGYAAMIDFAAGHGWVNTELGLVQAHCERRGR